MRREAVEQAERWARERLGGDSGGHDWHHIERVRRMALRLAGEAGADPFVCEMAALLHDLADDKLVPDPEAALREIRAWLGEHGVGPADAEHIVEIIGTMSFRGGGGPPMRTIEGRVVQDADRLDALGAIGIARTFAYSGRVGRPMHDPSIPPRERMTAEQYRAEKSTAYNHFHEKLLKLSSLMNTEAAKRIAEERHRFMEAFLARFEAEWEGKD